FPGWRETKTQGEYLFGKHGNPPEGGLSKLGEVGQFHIKRRRTKNSQQQVIDKANHNLFTHTADLHRSAVFSMVKQFFRPHPNPRKYV
ncbi:hypothetical protein, partial [Nitratidesulfovibrio oxamicus]|uniref:hypothetical protein n=1 Tax=Nitratidesulfovibrio oxamicus TaxID=32016 RepID=UPI001E3BD7B9